MRKLPKERNLNFLDGAAVMKKTLQIALDDQEIIELMRILMDNDP